MAVVFSGRFEDCSGLSPLGWDDDVHLLLELTIRKSALMRTVYAWGSHGAYQPGFETRSRSPCAFASTHYMSIHYCTLQCATVQGHHCKSKSSSTFTGTSRHYDMVKTSELVK